MAAAMTCLIIAGIACWCFVWGLRNRQRIVQSWTAVDAVVLQAEASPVAGFWLRVRVTFEYDMEGHPFLGVYHPRYLIPWSPQAAREWLTTCQIGDKFTLYVDPDNHQAYAVEPWPPLWLLLGEVGLLVVCLGIALTTVPGIS